MKNLLAFAAATLIAGTVLADAHLPKVEAEVRRVDAANAKLGLRHGEIPNLDMPPMSMVFQVADPKLLDGLKAGDKLMVTIDEIDGAYTVLSVERAAP